MFGYFRFNQLYASPKVKRVYKNYYCGTCFALEYNFGEISRFVLSYDVVILALIARLHEKPDIDILPCFLKKAKKKQFYNNNEWKKLAAINILLMKSKFDDDINDEKSTKAKAASLLFYTAIKKAEREFPELSAIVKNGYKEMYSLETERAGILNICNAFADLMVELVKTAFNVDAGKLSFLRGISRWLYFIDQLDDYDDDVKEEKSNPLVVEGISKNQLINKNNKELFEILRDIFKDYDELKRNLDISCSEDFLLYAVINESIPSVTSLVLSDKKLPEIMHKSKNVEWKGAEK